MPSAHTTASFRKHANGRRLVAGVGRKEASKLLPRLVLGRHARRRLEALCPALRSDRRREIGELLRQVSTEWGRSVLMVTHDPRIASFAQRLVLMRDGQVVDDVTLDGTREGPRAALEKAGLL